MIKTVITSTDRSLINLSEIRSYAGLFKYLSLRDVYVKYKQTWIGFGWSVIRPLINILIFGFLSYLIDPSENFSQRFIMVSAGVVFWQLISTTITEVSNSLSANSNILTKVYFPKVILPLSAVLVCIVDFLIAFGIFIILFILFYGWPSWQIIFLPMVVLYALLLSFGTGLLFATGSVKYRDVKFLLPFILQLLFYASPVFLSSEFILKMNLPEALKVLYQLNPFVFVLNAFKFCLTGNFESYDLQYAMVSVVTTLILLIISVRYFLNFEKSFADYI